MDTSPSQESTFEQTAAFEIVEAGQGYVLYDESRDRVHFLNSTAAIIYLLCERSCSLSEIAHELGSGFALDKAPIEEIELCLKNLEAEHLIRRS